MQLVGMFDSPYVRRVAVTLKHLELPFEHLDWSVGSDFERIRELSPLGRVPVLVADDGTVLVDSAAILDALDDWVGPARALIAGKRASAPGGAATGLARDGRRGKGPGRAVRAHGASRREIP